MAYVAKKAPAEADVGTLGQYVEDELQQIASVLQEPQELTVFHVEPKKPRAGVVAYADGTHWNPGGGGEGVYVYKSTGSWVKLG